MKYSEKILFQNSKLILKIPRSTWKIRYSYTDQNFDIFRIFGKNAFQKEICPYYFD